MEKNIGCVGMCVQVSFETKSTNSITPSILHWFDEVLQLSKNHQPFDLTPNLSPFVQQPHAIPPSHTHLPILNTTLAIHKLNG